MFKIENFIENDDIRVVDEKGPFKIIEYTKDLSVSPESAMVAYYKKEMNVRKRQVGWRNNKNLLIFLGLSNVLSTVI